CEWSFTWGGNTKALVLTLAEGDERRNHQPSRATPTPRPTSLQSIAPLSAAELLTPLRTTGHNRSQQHRMRRTGHGRNISPLSSPCVISQDGGCNCFKGLAVPPKGFEGPHRDRVKNHNNTAPDRRT